MGAPLTLCTVGAENAQGLVLISRSEQRDERSQLRGGGLAGAALWSRLVDLPPRANFGLVFGR